MNTPHGLSHLTRAALLALCCFASAHADIALTPLGDLPGGTVNSITKGISADGTTVVGYSSSANGTEAYRWTAATGIVALGDLPGGTFYSEARAASADGSVVIGIGLNSSSFNGGWRWTAATGLVAIPDLAGGIDNGMVYGVSADGLTVVGAGSGPTGTNGGYSWTAAGGHFVLPAYPGATYSTPNSISADGSTIVGNATRATGYTSAFRWTAAGGIQDLGFLPGGDQSSANATSADGSVVVGVSFVANFGRRAFRWTAATGMVDLGLLGPTGTRSEALACSADGSVVVGYSEGGAAGDNAFIWDATNGMRSLKSIVQTAGQAKRWTQFTMATGISADGTKIAGYGINGSGNTEAFLIDLNAPPPPPPPPATAGLVWVQDLPQTEAFKGNSVVRLAYDNGTGITDIATLTGASNGTWGGVEYANGFLLVPGLATAGTGTRVHHPRYAPILITNLYAYDLHASPGYLWLVNGGSRQVQKLSPTYGFTINGSVIDRTFTTVRTRNAGRFTNAVQQDGDTVFFSSTVTNPIGLYKLTAALLQNQSAVYTESGFTAISVYDFEVVGSYIYFGDITNNAIKRINTDGTGLVTLVTGAMFPNSIEVTADAIYWTELNTKLIRRAALDGSNATTVFELDNTPRGIAVVPLALIDGPAPQSIALDGLEPTFTGAVDTPVVTTPVATSGLPVTLEIVSGPATVSGAAITFTGTGTVHIRATQAGNASFAPTTFDTFVNATPRLAQTITFPALPNLVYTGTALNFALTGSASSGLPVYYSIVDGPAIATYDSNTNSVTITGLGTVTISAYQFGDETYADAAVATRTFNVTATAVANPFADFLAAAGIPSNQRGPLDDPDGDGLSNLLEFALGLAPATATTDGAPEVAAAGGVLSFTYTRAQSSGITYEVETSTDLTTWTTAGVTQGTPDTNGIVTATIALDVPGRYLRLKVSLTPAP